MGLYLPVRAVSGMLADKLNIQLCCCGVSCMTCDIYKTHIKRAPVETLVLPAVGVHRGVLVENVDEWERVALCNCVVVDVVCWGHLVISGRGGMTATIDIARIERARADTHLHAVIGDDRAGPLYTPGCISHYVYVRNIYYSV